MKSLVSWCEIVNWAELRKTILYWKDQLPAVGKTWMRWSARLLMLAGPAAFIGSFVLFGDTTESKLVGKWKVNRMVRNGDTLSATAWVTDSLSYSKLYFEQYGTCAFSSNPYAFQWDQARRGRYSFREKEGRLTAELKGRGPNKDSLHASIQFFNADSMMLHGAYKGDTIMLWMTREKSKR